MTKGTKFKLPSASKAGMQKKQGRNFLLPKEKPKRGMIPRPPKPNPEDFPNYKKPKPMPRTPVLRPGDVIRRPRLMREDPAKSLEIKKLKERIKKLMGRPEFMRSARKKK
tara:strand:- start:3502 stop:3831 length:330 start_codon:yes stop_codon:yes gene_type:complete